MLSNNLSAGYIGKVLCLIGLIVLSGCAFDTVKDTMDYARLGRDKVQNLSNWSFDGRIAVVSEEDSWSGGMSWRQIENQGDVRILGPLGQGGLIITIQDEFVGIDDGDNVVEFSSQDEEVSIANELGFYVPIRSLGYWVRGVVDPENEFADIERGFIQSGWQVEFKAMQETKIGLMPQKVYFTNEVVRIKLIVDQWVIND